MKHFLLLIGVFCSLFLSAQNSKSTTVNYYTLENGLSSGKIREIAQDKLGFIWVATEYGLNKYDGKTTKTLYSSSKKSSYHISYNSIFSLAPAHDYGMWIGTIGGLDKLNAETGQISHYSFMDKNNKPFLKPVLQIVPLNQSLCVLRSDTEGLYLFAKGDDHIKPIKATSYKPNSIPVKIQKYSDQSVIVVDKAGNIYELSVSGKVKLIDKLPYSLTYVAVGKGSRLYVSDVLGNVHVYENNKRLKTFEFPVKNMSQSEKFISSMQIDSDSILSIGTQGNGILELNLTKGWRIQSEINAKLINSRVKNLFKDSFKNRWVAHEFGGVSIIPFNTEKYKVQEAYSFLKNVNVLDVLQNKDQLYVATDGAGLFIINQLDSTYNQYNYTSGFNGTSFDNVVTSLHQDSTHVYVSTYNAGVFAILKNDQQLDFVAELQNVPQKQISTIYIDSQSRLWIGTYDDGIYVFDKLSKKVTKHYINQSKSEQISCNGITCFFEDTYHNIWIGSYYGISKISKDNKVESFIVTNYPDLKNNHVTSFAYFNKELFIGTIEGLSVYSYVSKDVSAIQIHSLIDNFVVSSLLYTKDGLYISTQQKLFLYNPKTKGVIQVADYAQKSASFNGMVLSKNSIYASTELGLFTKNIVGDKYSNSLQVQLSDVLVHGKSLFSSDVSGKLIITNGSYSLKFPAEIENISICFSNINFGENTNVEYEYFLENYSKEWQDVTNADFVNFASLKGGDYVFVLRDKNSKNKELLRIPISISKDITEYVLFYVILIICFVVIIYLIFKIRVKRIVSEKTRLENMVEIRVAEIKGQLEKIKQLESVRNSQEQYILQIKSGFREQQKELKDQMEKSKQALISKDFEIEQQQNLVLETLQVNSNLQNHIALLENQTNEMVFRITLPSEQFEYVSPAAFNLTGYSPQEFYDDSQLFRKIIVPAGKDDLKKFRKYMSEGKVPHTMKYKIITNTGIEKWVEQHANVVKDKNNKPLYVDCVLLDISQTKEIELQNKAAKKREIDMRNISLNNYFENSNNPNLDALQVFVNLFNQKDLLLDEEIAYLETDVAHSSYVIQFIEDYIDISKIDAEKLHFNYTQCSLNTLLQGICNSFNSRKQDFQKGHIQCAFNIEDVEDNFSFSTDTIRLRQVLMNLVGNAFKYTKNGTVEISYSIISSTDIDKPNSIQIMVTDTGTGMSDEVMRKCNSSMALETVDSMHLGLLLSKKIIKALGGKMIYSKNDPQGTKVIVELPLEKAKGLKQQLINTNQTTEQVIDWSKETVFIVESDEQVCDFIAEVLEPTKATIIVCKNPELAQEMFLAHKFQITAVLCNLQLSLLSNIDVVSNLKLVDDEIPIIALIPFGNYDAKIACLEKGCSSYIELPFKSKELKEILKRVF